MTARLISTIAAVALAGVSTEALAQAPAAGPAQASRATAYPADFFAKFAPTTALDIANHVPGFVLVLGDSNVRGFAGSSGNVVINGARPSSKAEALDQTLARIPARQVVRVEVAPGDVYGADYAGKSQVLNIILSAGKAVEGNVNASIRRFRDRGLLVPTASASVVLHRGPSELNFSAGLERYDRIENGDDDVRIPVDGPIVEHRTKVNLYPQRNPFAAFTWALGSTPENSSHVNFRYQRNVNGVRQTNFDEPLGFPAHDDRYNQDYVEPVAEIGGDIARPLAGGAIKLVGLATRRHRDYVDVYASGPPVLGGFHQVQDAKQGETIGRLSWSRGDLGGFSIEAGLEVAYNSLDNHLTYSVVNADGSETPVNFPLDNATVTETRGEGYVVAGRQLTPTLHLDGGLRYETSRLTVSGDAEAKRALSFFKPEIALDWNSHGWHARASLRRTVAQLNFYDFISAADLSTGRVNGGNANLVPQQTWESRFTLEHPFLGAGLLKLDLGYDAVNQLQDRILTDDGLDAPGNLGKGTRSFAQLTFDAPLDSLGIKGGRLKGGGTLQRTRVEDPSTHMMRHWTDFWPSWQWNIDYRQDLGRFSYGFGLQDRVHFTYFRTDQLDIQRNGNVYGTAFVEYRPDPATTVTFDVDNAFGTRGTRRLVSFDPNRTNPVPFRDEFRWRNSHANIGLTVKRTF